MNDFGKIKDEVICFFLELYKNDGGEIQNLFSSRIKEKVA